MEATLGQLLQKVQDPRYHSSGALYKSDPVPKSPITSNLLSEFDEVLEEAVVS
jgi:hypothetical protein